ncbi:MAG: T9SS type A sorting domain-containing protein [Bacteroidetes bacterium]|nr:T9SS type A sorting domain-containing protein [Bacteroidota bacterium]
MKTKLLFILSAIFFAVSLNAQPLTWNNWQQVSSGTNANLNYLASDNGSSKYYVTGDNGTILISTNSGIAWSLLNTGYTNSLKRIFLHNGTTYTICGTNGLIAKSTNNGINFTAQQTGTTNNINAMVAYGSNWGIAVGDNGTLLQTSNAGSNWNAASSGITSNLNFITVYDNLRGLIVGDNGVVIKSILDVPSFNYSYRRVTTGTSLNLKYAVVLDSNNIWIAASEGKLLHTTNSGVSWQTVLTGFTNDLNYINYKSAAEIYVCGAGGLILKTTNGGTSFIQMTSNTTQDLKGIIVNGNLGCAVGNGGTTLKNILYGNGGTFIKQQAQLNPNNISTWIWNTGVFNQDLRTTNTPGFEWPKGSGKFAIFSTGLSLAGFVNGEFRMANASYNGEYTGGYIENGIAKTGTDFQIFRVKPGDNCYNSVDYANWQVMIPFGAPYRDVNGNGQYDPCIDIPGVKNATQTVFISLTDGFPQTHTTSEGFSGGTAPMNADVHLTAWGYQDSSLTQSLNDVLFFKWEIINKNNLPWTGFYSSIVCDPDLGYPKDDYIGCDSTRNLGYCYNATDQDGVGSIGQYGIHPPALGMRLLKTPIRRNAGPNDTLGMTSFCYFAGTDAGEPLCEQDPSSAPSQSYNYMRGIKKDGTPWLNAASVPPYQTKYCYTGDPETATGWTEYFGRIKNCGGITTGNVEPSSPGDRRYIMSMGRDNFTFNPGDTQTVVMAQMIARGSNNKNSVTKLKQMSDYVNTKFKSGEISIGVSNNANVIVNSFNLYQNYPNPFNPVTTIKFQIPENTFASLKIYDVAGKEIGTLVNENLSRGDYQYLWNASDYPSGIYFYRLETPNYTQTKKMILVK